MSDDDSYAAVSGKMEFLVERAIVNGLKWYTATEGVIGSDLNIRRARDTSSSRAMPGMAVEAIMDQTIPRTNEYHARVQVTCETAVDNDADGQQVRALVGVVRDWLHIDRTSGGFDGDCEGCVEQLNDANRDIVFHEVHEVDTTPDAGEGRTRRVIMNVDAWCYPGATA